MKTIGVIPARYQSSRLPGKPLADICGKPMIWWVYRNVSKVEDFDSVYVATDDERIKSVCEKYNINVLMTSPTHDNPTSRMYEVSQIIPGDIYVFIGGDEPLVDPNAISQVVKAAKQCGSPVTHAMTKIHSAAQVIDFANIKVVVNSDNMLLYTSRSPVPYPKGDLDFAYMKFVGVGAFTKEALAFYHNTPQGKLEIIENCDLIRFLDKGIPIKMVEVTCKSLSVDTPKDLAMVRSMIEKSQLCDEKADAQ